MVQVVIADDYNDVYAAAPAIARLRQRATVTIYTEPHQSLAELVERLRDATIIIANRERLPLNGDLFDQLPALRLIAQTGRRGQHLDLAAATAHGILVAPTPGEAPGRSTAELTIGLLLAALRRIPYGDAEMRAGRWMQVVGRDAAGQRLGVIGLGRIGSQVARVARALGMTILAWGPTLTEERATANGATYRPLDDLLRECDIVTIHLQLSALSRGLLDRDRLALLRPHALLVNTSRAAILDQEALVERLRDGQLWGAALDVYTEEPLPSDHALRHLPNVVLSPHVGWIAEGSYREYIESAVTTILTYLDGQPLPDLLNPEALTTPRQQA